MAKDPVCGMEVSEKTALSLEHEGERYYFCSENCLKKFARENNIPGSEVAACLECASGGPFWRNKTFVVVAVLAALAGLSYLVPPLEAFRQTLFMYLRRLWWAIALGLILGGVIDHYVPREYISKILAGRGKRAIFSSVLMGFLMSACSHGILALSIQLHKKGASNPAVVAFLLASPWANMVLTIMLLTFFGIKALYIILSAIVIALVTGFIFQFLERKGLIEKNENSVDVGEDFSIIADIKERSRGYRFSPGDLRGVWKGAVSLGDMVLWWILIGMGIASIAGAYVPTEVFKSYMGPTVLGLFVTLAAATVIEVCSEGSAPMAFELFRQTGALGNSFVFLMAGVATDYTEIGLLWHNVGKRVAVWLPIVTVPQVVILGYIANIIF